MSSEIVFSPGATMDHFSPLLIQNKTKQKTQNNSKKKQSLINL